MTRAVVAAAVIVMAAGMAGASGRENLDSWPSFKTNIADVEERLGERTKCTSPPNAPLVFDCDYRFSEDLVVAVETLPKGQIFGVKLKFPCKSAEKNVVIMRDILKIVVAEDAVQKDLSDFWLSYSRAIRKMKDDQYYDFFIAVHVERGRRGKNWLRKTDIRFPFMIEGSANFGAKRFTDTCSFNARKVPFSYWEKNYDW